MLTVTREGPFWDAVEGRAPLPPAAVTLGWELVAIDPEEGTIEVAFTAGGAFLNPAGVVQGGFLAAMLDDTMGPAVFMKTEGRLYTATISMNINFLAPAKVGPIIAEATIVQLGKTVAFIEGKLMDETGCLLATATANARLVETGKAIG